nr:replication protein A 70 kDa DNA-binding subunit B [Tanacetum cinerariifolium]
MEINGKPGQKLQCQIQDLKSNELQCTFWGEYARQIDDYVSNVNSTKNKIVIVVQYGLFKIWRGLCLTVLKTRRHLRYLYPKASCHRASCATCLKHLGSSLLVMAAKKA